MHGPLQPTLRLFADYQFDQLIQVVGREPNDILADLKWRPRLFAEPQTVQFSAIPLATWRKLNEGMPLMRRDIWSGEGLDMAPDLG